LTSKPPTNGLWVIACWPD